MTVPRYPDQCGSKLVTMATLRQLERLKVEAIKFKMKSEVRTSDVLSVSLLWFMCSHE